MKRIVVYGSKHWPTCQPAKAFLSENDIKFAYRDISENMLNLKLFLKHRDNNPVFDEIKKNGNVGLPCFVIGGGKSIVFDIESLDVEDLKRWNRFWNALTYI